MTRLPGIAKNTISRKTITNGNLDVKEMKKSRDLWNENCCLLLGWLWLSATTGLAIRLLQYWWLSLPTNEPP